MFQANDQEEMVAWVNAINQAVQVESAEEASGAGGAAGGKSQTLPASSIEKAGSSEPKKRGFFTLKKK